MCSSPDRMQADCETQKSVPTVRWGFPWQPQQREDTGLPSLLSCCISPFLIVSLPPLPLPNVSTSSSFSFCHLVTPLSLPRSSSSVYSLFFLPFAVLPLSVSPLLSAVPTPSLCLKGDKELYSLIFLPSREQSVQEGTLCACVCVHTRTHAQGFIMHASLAVECIPAPFQHFFLHLPLTHNCECLCASLSFCVCSPQFLLLLLKNFAPHICLCLVV